MAFHRAPALPVLVGLLAVAAPCAGETIQVYRCESSDGVTVYSDTPCGAGTVLELDADHMGAVTPVGSASALPRRKSRGMCPAPTAADLPGAISHAFASGDVNDLASLYHWTGLTQGDARRMFGRFDELLAQPLQDVGMGSAPVAAEGYGLVPASDGVSAFASDLWLQLGPAQAPRTVHFRIVENAGCAWLRFG